MREDEGGVASPRLARDTRRTTPGVPCAQFLAADAEASATAALVRTEHRTRAPVQQPQAQEAGGGAAPVSKAGTSPAASVAKEPEVVLTPEPAAWNVATGRPSAPVKLEHIHIL